MVATKKQITVLGYHYDSDNKHISRIGLSVKCTMWLMSDFKSIVIFISLFLKTLYKWFVWNFRLRREERYGWRLKVMFFSFESIFKTVNPTEIV